MRTLVVTGLSLLAGTTLAAPQFRAEEIQAPPNTVFRSMNSFGTLVGEMTTSINRKGIIRKPNGDVVIVSAPAGYSGYHVHFTDVNESGRIAGTLVHAFNNTGYGFVYDEATGFRIMNSDPNEAIASTSMTDDGLMAFTYSAGSGLWNPSTNEFTSIPRHGLESAVNGVRAAGWDWSWHNGEFTTLQGTGTKFAQSISANGLVAGYKFVNSRRGAAIWNAEGQEIYTEFSASFQAVLESVTSDGRAVGSRFTNSENFGTFYSSETGTVNINSLITERNFSGSIHRAYRIEENGKILSLIVDGDQARTVILTPVPEPGTMLALGAGLAALLRRRRTT